MIGVKYRSRFQLGSQIEVTKCDMGDYFGAFVVAGPVDQNIVGLDICAN